ncbi:hypothetical protein [Yersinia phage vB_YenM_P744]
MGKKILAISLGTCAIVGALYLAGSPIGSQVRNYMYVMDWQDTIKHKGLKDMSVGYNWSDDMIEVTVKGTGTEDKMSGMNALVPGIVDKAFRQEAIKKACRGPLGVEAMKRGASFKYLLKPIDSNVSLTTAIITLEDCK